MQLKYNFSDLMQGLVNYFEGQIVNILVFTGHKVCRICSGLLVEGK